MLVFRSFNIPVLVEIKTYNDCFENISDEFYLLCPNFVWNMRKNTCNCKKNGVLWSSKRNETNVFIPLEYSPIGEVMVFKNDI